ncbi:MAG: MFS transporter [Acidobacteriales bacterium]|nr:MFS transporter [Terriglobales bacterium]
MQASDREQVPTATLPDNVPRHSLRALNAANFFQAEMIGVILPVLNAFLRESNWRYDAIGLTTAAAGLGTLLFQTPAGWLTDRLSSRRLLFAVMALATGACFVALPLVPRTIPWVDTLLFISGATQSFFVPLLGALALGLVGHKLINRVMGVNQSWNHAGNIAAALLGMALVAKFGLTAVLYSVGAGSLLAGAAVVSIRSSDLNSQLASGHTDDSSAKVPWKALLRNRTILFLLLSISLFHLANAPILPTVALYVKNLGGSDTLMTATVLTAQIVMVPVAWIAGRLCDSVGRKAVMAVAFWVLPLRILSYVFARNPAEIVALQALDGIGAGIYGVAVVAFSAELTRGKGGFNTLMGLFATALAVGGVAGPLLSGLSVQHLGFKVTFYLFAALAALGAAAFSLLVPSDSPAGTHPLPSTVAGD